MAGLRLDLPAINSSLEAVQADFARINANLAMSRDPMTDEVRANMMAGYALVDDALGKGLDLFELGNSQWLLELNTLVLCGADKDRRDAYAQHIAATGERFYQDQNGGIAALIEWLRKHSDKDVWKRAAGAYIHILSRPQLYLEGNHRTGALVMSLYPGAGGTASFRPLGGERQGLFRPPQPRQGDPASRPRDVDPLTKAKKAFRQAAQGEWRQALSHREGWRENRLILSGYRRIPTNTRRFPIHGARAGAYTSCQSSNFEEYAVTMTIAQVGLLLALTASATYAADVSQIEKRRLFEPTPSELREEEKGRIYIYEGLTDRDVERALEDEFERVDSMMFIRIKPTDEKGETLKNPETGEDLYVDDGC